MATSRRFRKSSAAALLFVPAVLWGLNLPAGSEVQIRLQTKISTQSARAQDAVDAVVIAPVLQGGQLAIPQGALVHGVVEKTSQPAKAEERAVLLLHFTAIEIDGTS